MNVEQLLAASGIAEKDITRRVAEIDLFPQHEESTISIRFRVLSPGKLRSITKQGEREYKLAKKGGKLRVKDGEPDWEEWDFTGRILSAECVEAVVGLTPQNVRAYGILPLTTEQVTAMESALGGKSLDRVDGFLELLSRESRPYRQRLFELQEVAKVVEAEDSLRKKLSSASSATSDSGGA